MQEKEEFARFPIKRKIMKRNMANEETSKIDRLFETEWEVLVVELDHSTGEFRTRTDHDESLVS